MIDTACSWVKPLYLTEHDINAMDVQTKRDILAHNKSWQTNCLNQVNETHAIEVFR